MIAGSNSFAVTQTSDIAPAPIKKFLDIQATTDGKPDGNHV